LILCGISAQGQRNRDVFRPGTIHFAGSGANSGGSPLNDFFGEECIPRKRRGKFRTNCQPRRNGNNNEKLALYILMTIHTGQVKLASLRSLIQLAHRNNVPAYSCLREKWEESNWMRARKEALFRFNEAADGITTFNRFDPAHQLWHELGDSDKLRKLLGE